MKDGIARSPVLLFILILLGLFAWTGYYGGYVYTFTVPLFWVLFIRKKPAEILGLSKNNIVPSVFTGGITGILLSVLGGLILKWSGHEKVHLPTIPETSPLPALTASMFTKSADGYLLLRSSSFWGCVLYFFYILLAVGLGEELFWRGFVQNYLMSRKGPPWFAVSATSVLFVLVHIFLISLMPVRTFSLFLALIGCASMLWGLMFYRFKNLWGCAISHGITAFVVWRCFFYSL